jgi:hypothetical protein
MSGHWMVVVEGISGMGDWRRYEANMLEPQSPPSQISVGTHKVAQDI